MRLIDADKLKEDVLSWGNCYNGYSDAYDKAMIIDEIDEQPTVDAERHGYWIDITDPEIIQERECSLCHKQFFEETEDYRYCPNCGAKMDEVEER